MSPINCDRALVSCGGGGGGGGGPAASYLCTFDSPYFTNRVSGSITPTFGIDPTNTNFPQATGSFTNGYGSICSFPTIGVAGGKTTTMIVTPTLVPPGKAGTACSGGFLAPASTSQGGFGSTTYTSFMCPSFTYNQMATGTWTLSFSEATGSAFAPVVFVIASPTSLTDYVYGTITSTTTLPPAPTSTTTVTQTTGTTIQTSTLSPQPSSTTTATAYSTTVITTAYSNPPPVSIQTVTDYTTTILSTVSLPAEPSSTTTVTEFSGTSVATEISTSTISNTDTLTEYICASSSSSFSSTPSSTPTPTPTPLSCPEDDGKSYTAADGAIFTIECVTDHYGGNLAMSYQPNLETCIELCESTTGCVDVSWLPGNPSGPCYLKKNVGETQTNSGVWGALKAVSPTFTTSSSIASVSNALPMSSPTGVSPACPNGVYSFAPSCPDSDGTCFATNGALYIISCFTDDYGGDLALSWETTFESCLTTCSTTAGCIDVSYVAPSDSGNGPCYMKSAIGAAQADARIWGARLIPSATASATSDSTFATSTSSTTLSSSFMLVPRVPTAVPFTKGPNYTYPPIPHTTVTTGPTSTATATPAASGITTSTTYVLAAATSFATPAPSGVQTTTVTTASTSTITITYAATVLTTTLQDASTSFTTVTPANSGIAYTTVTLEATPTSVEFVFSTATAQTITITGCLPASSSTTSSFMPIVTPA